MEGKSSKPTKKSKQNAREPINHSNDNSDLSEYVIREQMTSESRLSSNRTRQLQTGRPGTTDYQRKRRNYKSNPNIVLSQVFDVNSQGYMKIYKNLFGGVESWEMNQFVGNYKVMVRILKLLMEDRFLHLQIATFQEFDLTNQLLCEPVPRTFFCGLIKLRQHKHKNQNLPLEITETEIKALYISSLLLIGVGQIDKKYKNQGSNESQEAYFHKIVTYLLDESAFLTPKLFYYVSGNWNKIMEIINSQLQFDRLSDNGDKEKVQKKPKSLSGELNRLQIEQKRPLKIKFQEQKQEKNSQRYKLEDSYQMDEEYEEIKKSDHVRKTDLPIKFLSDSKPSQQNEQSFMIVNPQVPKVNLKRPNPTVPLKGKIETEKKMKLDPSIDPAVLKAIKYYNYMKYYTRIRNKNVTKKQVENKRKKEPKQESKQESKEEIKEQIKPEIKQIHYHEASIFYDDEPNFLWTDKEQKYQYRRRDSFESLELDFSQTSRLSSEDKENKMSSEEIESNHQQQTEQQSEEEEQMEVESQNTSPENPNRKVPHQRREIDFMIKKIIEDRFVLIHSIANQIYHSMKAANVELISEPRDQGCRRNLLRDFQQD